MTWSFLYKESLEKKENNTSTDENVALPERLVQSEQEDAYQKKLFESDLYVWSLLLLRNNDI